VNSRDVRNVPLPGTPPTVVRDQRQFITLIVHLCAQHDAREKARRADPSATADSYAEYTCLRLFNTSISCRRWTRAMRNLLRIVL